MLYRIAVVSMAKPSFLRAEQSMAPDLSIDRVIPKGGASTRRPDLVFVVNPRGANGRTGKDWKNLLPYLRSRLGEHCNICESLTSGPHHAVELTREAIREGAEAVIAVGGDGTLHEVVNGFFWGGNAVSIHDQKAIHTTALGLIPLGTGSDFARTFGWKNDPLDAIERIAKGVRTRIDVGALSGDNEECHYFLNVADIHLSAKAGFYASQYKRFGNLCYVIGALQAFIGHHNQDFRIKVGKKEKNMSDLLLVPMWHVDFRNYAMPNSDTDTPWTLPDICRACKWCFLHYLPYEKIVDTSPKIVETLQTLQGQIQTILGYVWI